MFDGARTFNSFAIFAMLGALLTFSVGGGWSLLGVIIGLYYLRGFTSSLSARDRRDRLASSRPRRRRR